MTDININSYKQQTVEISGIKSISFHHMGEKVFSADQADVIYGVFVSQVIVAPLNLVRWHSIEVSSTSLDNVWVYVRNADSNIESAPWNGPYKNFVNSIETMDMSMLQFMIVLKDDGAMSTKVDGISVKYVSSDNAKVFFSKTFNIGFRAEHVLLTYNADMSDDAVLRFAISGEDTIDPSKYQYIDPNKIQELTGISIFSDKIKLMMELAGDSGIPLKVHEIALVFGGDLYDRVNVMYDESSSSMSSSEDV